MPGLSVSLSDGQGPARFREALDQLLFFDRYETTVLSSDSPGIGVTAAPDYPVRSLETDDRLIVFEGRRYGRSLTDDDLLELGERIVDPTATDEVRSWLRHTDGEYVVMVADRGTGEVTVVNDLFGRLPVYVRSGGTGGLVSREIRFVLSPGRPTYDRLGIAQTLLFGYPLGTRTLWEEVSKLPSGSRLRAEGDAVAVERLHEFDFGRPRYADRSIERNARELAERFVRASRARTANGPSVVSLSGGHDSRAVAAALGTSGATVRAATFSRDGRTRDDVRIARSVADRLDLPWERHDLNGTSADAARTLLELKAGLNHVGMGFILEFLERLQSRHGPAFTYLTGDGGDKALPDLTPPVQLSSIDALVEHVIARNRVWDVERAAKLAGVSRGQLRDSVRSVLERYPEPSYGDRYVHFLTHERGFNWLFEGEDRNRYYGWSTSPFYAAPVFRYAMNVPPEQKRHNRYYKAFLKALWPPAVSFDDADLGAPMDSLRYPAIQRGLAFLGRHPMLEDVVRRLYRGELRGHDGADLRRLVRAQLRSIADEAAEGPFPAADVPLRSSRHGLVTLLTVAAAVESTRAGGSVLERRPGVVIA